VGVIVVPELRRAARELATLEDVASAFPGSAQVPELRRSLTAQLGFDVLDPDGLSGAGIDPRRGLAVGLESSSAPAIVVLPVRDAGALRGLVKRVARERLGASHEAPLEGSPSAYTYAPEGGGPPVLALGLAEDGHVAVLAAGPGSPAAVRTALARKAADSLAETAGWRDLRKAFGERYAFLFAFLVPDGSRAAELPFDHPMAVGLTALPGSVRLGARVQIDRATAAALPGRGDAKARAGALSPQAPLVLRWDGDPAALGRVLVARVPEHDRRWLADRGFDVQKDLFDLFAPGVAASVSLSPRLDLSDLSDVALRADPLRLVSFELSGEVRDEKAAGPALARLPALFAALQEPVGKPRPATVDPTGRAGRISLASGEIAWRLEGKELRLVGGPAGALDALLARKGGWTAPTKDAATALEGGLGGAVLAPRRLAASVRALPDDAFGTGPFGFVVRGIVDRYLEALETVAAVSVRAEPAEGALLVETRIEVPPPARGGKP
jgi:hypothetical protein